MLPQTGIIASTLKRAPENVSFSVNTALDSCTKAAHRIASVEMLVNNILDQGSQEAVLSLKPALVFSEKLPEVMKKHPAEDCALRMSEKVNPCLDRSDSQETGQHHGYDRLRLKRQPGPWLRRVNQDQKASTAVNARA
ncbi:MAG: hypothetical protein GTN76_08425 [Candidatus Aenigmarchaeota archaeon]|nr:hypothetical protein [Candidatus Aenigmarchaeota archaeon]